MHQILSNAILVTPNQVDFGTLVIEDGRITELKFGAPVSAAALDLKGDYLLPGLVDLRT